MSSRMLHCIPLGPKYYNNAAVTKYDVRNVPLKVDTNGAVSTEVAAKRSQQKLLPQQRDGDEHVPRRAADSEAAASTAYVDFGKYP